ncbi:S8 family serine peptidase [Haliea sp. E1-2-M8]|uniref:S8 family serine peptidase n=1 Tax=Haliea sp. E1-2-M8 TaxID=3064706 RepID=UPI0027244271|nr:S8 family serine peptidase [Haliea sp. E1-2-M8]MDO8862942.1 S8 family serine peptidase [Haliea sp. E1-2-M8]
MDESELEDRLEDDIEEDIAEDVEDGVDDAVGETIEESIEESIQDTIDESVESSVEESVAGVVEETVEESVEDSVEDSVEESVAGAVEESVEESVEEEVVASVEESVEENVAASVEESVEEDVATSVEESVEENVAAAVEKSVEEDVATSVEESVEENVAASVEESVEENVAASVEDSVAFSVADGIEERLETEIDSVVDELESQLEIDEARINTRQWLVMAEPEVFEELAVEGYLFDRVTELSGMGLLLAEVEAPSSFEIYDIREGVIDVVGTGRAEVDLNHVYTAGAPVQHSVEGSTPRSVLRFPADIEDMPLRLGMIDSLVDTAHPALSDANIHSEAFTSEGASMPSSHGTAIASIFIGRDQSYLGLAPQAELYAAAVFEQDPSRGEIASTVSLVRALDWLMSSGVDVVNISLAGPPNRLLEKALDRAALRGVLIFAAAGNGGPMAKPMYPAAYPSVIAVTAVDASGRIFRLANRGDYVDLAAPGVGLLHARSGGGYATSSGTSFAVPFVATAAARLRLLTPLEDIRAALIRSVQDEGSPGRDDTYGYGVLRFAG